MLVHGLTNKPSNNSPSDKEIEFIKNFKNKYPVISITQFQDIYHEDVIWNSKMAKIVKENNLKVRSYSFYESLFKRFHWVKPIKHRCFNKEYDCHPLREPSPQRGILIMIDGNLTQFGHMCEDLGINIIAANTPQAKGKVEKWNNTIQNRLINDIKRYNIESIDELNKFFNDYYCNYLNQKYAYEPKDNNSTFVPLDNINLSNILCIRNTRTILNGNMISWNNNYYQILDKDNSIKQIYKGTEIDVFENVLTKVVKVKYYNIFYNTKQIEGHRQDSEKRKQMRIDNQK